MAAFAPYFGVEFGFVFVDEAFVVKTTILLDDYLLYMLAILDVVFAVEVHSLSSRVYG